MPLMGEFAELDIETADARMIGEFFGGIDTRASVPDLLAIAEEWRPGLIIRESWEFGSTIVAEIHGIPIARVALGVASLEQRSIRYAAPVLDEIGRARGLPPDPAGERLRVGPYFTAIPKALDREAAPASKVHRWRAPSPATDDGLPKWWPGNDDPLVYLSFGSVAAEPHLPYFPALYAAAIDALAAMPIRLLVTIGKERDPAELDSLPPNVRVERWIPQDAILPHADAAVCHGGHGSTLGALSHGVPLIVVPLFSGDQWDNARAVADAGAGIALDHDRATRRVLEPPGTETIGALAPAVHDLLGDQRFRARAEAISNEIRELPTVDEAVTLLQAQASRAP